MRPPPTQNGRRIFDSKLPFSLPSHHRYLLTRDGILAPPCCFESILHQYLSHQLPIVLRFAPRGVATTVLTDSCSLLFFATGSATIDSCCLLHQRVPLVKQRRGHACSRALHLSSHSPRWMLFSISPELGRRFRYFLRHDQRRLSGCYLLCTKARCSRTPSSIHILRNLTRA